MIEIVEGEKWYDNSPFTGGHWMIPVYMVKDGEQHFMFNRTDPSERIYEMQDEDRRKQLESNDGMFFTFNAPFPPFDLLKMFAERKLTFENSCIAEQNIEYSDRMKCWDFAGNAREVSTAFHYRIYDGHLAAAITQIVRRIKDKEFAVALQTLKELPENLKKQAGSDF